VNTDNIQTFFLDYANLVFDDLLDQNKRLEFEKKLDGFCSIADPNLVNQLKFALCKLHGLVANEGIAAVEELHRADSNPSQDIPPTEKHESAEQKTVDRIVFYAFRHQQQIVDAAYGYRDGYCENFCDERQLRRDLIGIDRFQGDNRPKCYECDQMFARSILLRIANGDSLKNIQGFERLIAGQSDFFKSAIEILDDKISKKLILADADFIINMQQGFPDNERLFKYRYLIAAFVSFSLGEFLQQKDRRKLKKCPHCGELFIALKVDRVRCYKDQCRREYHKKDMQKRREEYPLYGQRVY